MGGKVRKRSPYAKLLRKIGLMPEDNEFNRRAAEYTKKAIQMHHAAKQAAKLQLAKAAKPE